MGSLGLSDACRLRRAPKSDARLPGLEERWSISFEMSDGVVSVGAARATNGLLKKLGGTGRRIKTGRQTGCVELCPIELIGASGCPELGQAARNPQR